MDIGVNPGIQSEASRPPKSIRRHHQGGAVGQVKAQPVGWMVGVGGCQGEVGLGVVHPAVAAVCGIVGVERDAVAARRRRELIVAEGLCGVEVECED